jgi:hypothetical protein
MSYITPAELPEIVPDLRAMASIETSGEVRAALLRLADRYAAPGFTADWVRAEPEAPPLPDHNRS